MTLSDSAEYWWDVNKPYEYTGRQFYHLENVDCGHRKHHIAKTLKQVNCFACLKLIENGYKHNLK